MAYKSKTKPTLEGLETKRKADAYALACLIYDIWQEKKLKEHKAKEAGNDQRK